MINELKEKLAEAQAQLSASQKEIQVKSNRLDISRESLKEIEKKLLQLKSERQTALASGEKPDKIDRLIDTVKKDQVDLQDTISGCLTAVESAKDNMESAKEAVKTLQEEIATAELLATVDEYNAAAFQFSEMCEKIFRLSAAAGGKFNVASMLDNSEICLVAKGFRKYIKCFEIPQGITYAKFPINLIETED